MKIYVVQNVIWRECFAHENFFSSFRTRKKNFFHYERAVLREYGKLPKMFVDVFINTVAAFLIKINETDAFRFRIH